MTMMMGDAVIFAATSIKQGNIFYTVRRQAVDRRTQYGEACAGGGGGGDSGTGSVNDTNEEPVGRTVGHITSRDVLQTATSKINPIKRRRTTPGPGWHADQARPLLATAGPRRT